MKIFILKVKIFVIGMILLACNTPEPAKDLGLKSDPEPQKTMVYQILDGTENVGYAYRYEWEPQLGKVYYYYLITDLFGNIIGSTRQDGHTEKYLAKGEKKFLGNYSVNDAVAEILTTTAPIKMMPEPKEELEFRLAKEAKETKDSNWSWYKSSSSQSSSLQKESPKSSKEPTENKFGEPDKFGKIEMEPEATPENNKGNESEGETEEWEDVTESWPGN